MKFVAKNKKIMTFEFKCAKISTVKLSAPTNFANYEYMKYFIIHRPKNKTKPCHSCKNCGLNSIICHSKKMSSRVIKFRHAIIANFECRFAKLLRTCLRKIIENYIL